MPEIEKALGIEPGSNNSGPAEPGSTRLLEPVPEPGEIKVSVKDEIGSTPARGLARPGTRRRDPVVAVARDGRTRFGPPRGVTTSRTRKFFPQPETTEWSVSELEYRRNRPS